MLSCADTGKVAKIFFASSELKSLRDTVAKDLESAVSSFKTLELPTYDAGSLAEFNKRCTQKLISTLASTSTAIQSALENARTTSARLKLPESFAPDMDTAKIAAREALTMMATATAVKILCSQAAKKQAGGAKANAKGCMDFCRTHGVELPADLQAKLSEL